MLEYIKKFGDIMVAKNNEIIKDFKNIIKNINKYKDLTVSDDLQVLKIALDFNLEIKKLFYVNDISYQENTKNLLENLKTKALDVYEISSKTYESLKLKENHAGIIALIKMPNYNLDYFKKLDYVIVLDKLEIPGNLGTIYRTCDSINVKGIILVDEVTKLNNINTTSSSRGCNLIIPTISLSYDEALNFLLNNGYNIYLGEPILGKNYQEYDYNEKVALVMGNERFGINQDWYNHQHKAVYIPMEGNQNSLNVAIATSIIAYEIYMKKRKY